MIRTITERARAIILDSQALLEFWGEAVNPAVYLHQRMANEGLTRSDDRDGFKAPYNTPYEMLHSYGKPEFDKPLDDPTCKRINYSAPLRHLCRFGCYTSRLIPEKQRTDQKLGAWSMACMMVGYVHDSTTLWRIWDPEHNTVKAQSDVIFDEERNAYISSPQSLQRKQGVYDDEPKEMTEIDIFGLPQEETHIEDIDASGTDESMAHGRTHDTSGTGESMSHGRTDEVARRPVAGNPAAVGANSDLPLTGHSTNAHGDRSPPASGVKNGHTHTHMAPDEDAHTHTDNGHSSHCPTLESHHQAPSRHEVITQRELRRSVAATNKRSKKAPVLTDRATRSRAQVNDSELIHNALALTTIDGDPRSYEEAMLSPLKKQWQAAIMEESNSIIQDKTFSPVNLQELQTNFGARPSAKTKSPSLNLFSLLYPQTQKNEIEVSLKYGIA